MNPLPWMTLVFLLSARSSLAVVDQNWLTGIVSGIRAEYKINEQFCLAANIPRDLKPKDLHQVLEDNRYEGNVKDIINGCEVYEGNNVVVAKPVESVHAEPQVLQNMKQLTSNKQNNILLIYSYLSPCGEKCTKLYHKYNILKYMEKIKEQQQKKNVPHWSDVVFVFTRVFDSPKSGNPPTKEELKESLERLGNSGLHLQNIFRCYKPENLEFQCHSCSSNTKVSDVCVDNNFVPGQGGRSSPVRDRSRSSSSGRSSSNSSSSRSSSSGRSSSNRGSSRSSSNRGSSRGSSRGSNRSSSRGSSNRGSRGSSRSSSRGSSNRGSRGSSRSSSNNRSSSRSSSRGSNRSSSRGSSNRGSSSGSSSSRSSSISRKRVKYSPSAQKSNFMG